jgi:hypothetical protein
LKLSRDLEGNEVGHPTGADILQPDLDCLPQYGDLFATSGIVVQQQSQPVTHHFVGGRVFALLNFVLDELGQFIGQADIHPGHCGLLIAVLRSVESLSMKLLLPIFY